MRDEDYAPNIVARFWMKVSADNGLPGCWEWQASKVHGYGQFGVRAGDIHMAHRYAYEYIVGPIPEGLHIDHLCRNPGCVNPSHLEPVTIGENMRRGLAPPAHNARKTHCIHGHLFDEENTYLDRRGRRHCRACRKRTAQRFRAQNPAYQREYKQRKRELSEQEPGGTA